MTKKHGKILGEQDGGRLSWRLPSPGGLPAFRTLQNTYFVGFFFALLYSGQS